MNDIEIEYRNRVQRVVDALGGMSAMSRALGHANPTTVQGWIKRGQIPWWHHEAVCKILRTRKITLPARTMKCLQSKHHA